MFDAALFDPIRQYASQGGDVIWVLFSVCLLLWGLIVERLIYLHREVRAEHRALAEYWQDRSDKHSWYAEKIREEALSISKGRLQRGLSTISVLVAICPLLGLLGTVTGMVGVFDTIAITGTSDAKAMADGIYRATLPTMTGLVLALSGLYFVYHLKHRAQRQLDTLYDALVLESAPALAEENPARGAL
ncbi:Uncharacterised protein [BD1-7 clade bacterium]|uniref:MotA/TolQ/ExbB proton channel domain-containing protein n=1 Tax=BD1-7 clade bacterium TaxID=2029982 RepID=A0A5S9QTI2_9GAMM|nr:Uncharacterised protein [BD1-7 clade bacterium]